MSWARVTLSELGSFKNGVNFKANAMGSGLPMVNVKDVTDSPFLSASNLALVQLDPSADYFAEKDDIFFVRSSVKLDGIGLVGRIRGDFDKILHCGFVIRLRPDTTRVDTDFLVYLLLSPEFRQRIKNLSGGAAIVNVSQAALKSLEVPLPPIDTQREIAARLRTIDDLIENNRRRIALLEQSARLLYREWFVYLRFPGHEHINVVDGVPEGWERKTMADVAETVGGGTPSTAVSAYWDDGEITWFSPTDLTNNDCLALLSSGKKITEAGLKNSSAKMLPPETILMSSRASIGYFGLHDKPACTNQGFISLIPRDEQYRYYLLYNLMFRKDEIESKAGGTTYKEINKSTFRGMTITWPEKTLANSFSDFARDVMQQVRALKRQNEKLAQTRDLLLPRLMSGDLVV